MDLEQLQQKLEQQQKAYQDNLQTNSSNTQIESNDETALFQSSNISDNSAHSDNGRTTEQLADSMTDIVAEQLAKMEAEITGDFVAERSVPIDHKTGIECLDFASLRRKNTSWRDFYKDEQSYPLNVLSILKNTFLIKEDWLYPMIAAYLIFPSALGERVPILQAYGTSGTGKSTLGHLACKLHGVKSRTANDTDAALRRILDNSRWLYATTKEYEQNVILVYEDLDEQVLTQNNKLIYRLLKLGYDRLSGYISIASEKQGEVIEQFIYCPKIISSTHPLFNFDPELYRRTLVVKTEELELPSSLISIPSISWEGLEVELKRYWNTPESVEKYLLAHDELDTALKGVSASLKAVIHDLSAVMVSCGLIELGECRNFWKQYQDYKLDVARNQSSGFKLLLSNYLQDYQDKSSSNPLMSPALEVNKLDSVIESWQHQKVILEKPRSTQLEEAMRDLGYGLKPINNKGFWVKL